MARRRRGPRRSRHEVRVAGRVDEGDGVAVGSNVATPRLRDACAFAPRARSRGGPSRRRPGPGGIAPALKSSCSAGVVLLAPECGRTTFGGEERRSSSSWVVDMSGTPRSSTAEARAAHHGHIPRPRCPVIPSGPRSSARRARMTQARGLFTKVARRSASRRDGRRRSRSQLPAAARDREGARGQHARGQHQMRDRAATGGRRPSSSRRSSTRATARVASRFSSRRGRQPQPDGSDVRSIFTKAGGQLAGTARLPGSSSHAAWSPSAPEWPGTRSRSRRSTRAPRTSTPTIPRPRGLHIARGLETVRQHSRTRVLGSSAETRWSPRRPSTGFHQGAPGAPDRRAARGPRRRPASDRQLRHPRGRLPQGRRSDRPLDRPGTASLRYGSSIGSAELRAVDYGCFTTAPMTRLPVRLLAPGLSGRSARAPPADVVGVGACLAQRPDGLRRRPGPGRAPCRRRARVPVREATPSEVKLAVSGHGAADQGRSGEWSTGCSGWAGSDAR